MICGEVKIDIARAIELRESGLSFREIGIQLADENNRPVVLLGGSIESAIRRSKKGISGDEKG